MAIRRLGHTVQNMEGFWRIYIVLVISFKAVEGTFVTHDCYGSVISLSCSAGHKIKILDDFFGLGPNPDRCEHKAGDCTVVNGRDTSVIHRYCEGKQACTQFQVDRRYCGNNQTSYEQVEYECIPDSSIHDICTSLEFTGKEGYLATPRFPHHYPSNLNCRCSLEAMSSSSRVKIEATHFIVKYDSPCKDWLEIETAAGKRRRVCGAYSKRLASRQFNLTFHSDAKEGHQGFWIKFAVYPLSSNDTLKLKCGEFIPTTTPATTTTSPTTTTTASTTTPPTTTSATTTTDGVPTTTTAVVEKTTSKPKPTATTTSTTTTQKVKVTIPIKAVVKSKNDEQQIQANALRTSTTIVMKPRKATRKGSSTMETVTFFDWPTAQPTGGINNVDYIEAPETIDEQRKVMNRMTGIIIISICVGGIVLLIAILGILLCISKRRRPKKRAEKSRKKRLEQRLNSLSFYDSIPLYDSIGRKGLPPSMSVPLPPGSPNHHGIYNMGMVGSRVASPGMDSKDSAPYWTSIHDIESDHDSAIYAELDKQSRENVNPNVETPKDERKEKKVDDGSVILKPPEKLDDNMYTHV